MTVWEWELFESEISPALYTVSDTGPLYGPITDFKVFRDKHLGLRLQTISVAKSTTTYTAPPGGAICIARDLVKLKARVGGDTVVFAGVIPTRSTSIEFTDETSIKKTQESSLHWIRWERISAGETCYTIEWVGNLSSSFLWPHTIKYTSTGEKKIKFGSSKGAIEITSPIQALAQYKSCACLTIDGLEVIIGTSRHTPNHVEAPGFILYKGMPSEETRRKIRDCLSFCLGDFLLDLGYTSFNSEWDRTAFTAKSGHALVSEARRLRGHQPSPLGRKFKHEIDAEILGKSISALIAVYDKYNLRNSFWCYWHAIAAPVHMAAVHFGSAIEALQERHLAQLEGKPTKLIDDSKTWCNLLKQLRSAVKETEVPNEIKQVLLNNVANLNSAPHAFKRKRFMESLGLSVGTLEIEAWRNRNSAAHGNTSAENAERLIRENKALQTLLNRILLSIAGAQAEYYDYYTIGRPTSPLNAQIKDDRSKDE
jgi:hypothetical protein